MPSPSLAALTGFPELATKIVVGVGDLAVSNNPSVTLATYSLGSCLGISIYDPVSRTGGLLHAMLPNSQINPADAASNPARFIDTGVPALFRAAYQLRAEKHRVQICVAGGAQLMDEGRYFNIGQRNYQALCTLFRNHSLKIDAEQVGGFAGRTMTLNLASGEVRLKTAGCSNEHVLFKR